MKHYPPKATHLTKPRKFWLSIPFAYLLLLFSSLAHSLPEKDVPTLKSHNAVYTGEYNGISAKLQQTLSAVSNIEWQMENKLSVFWMDLKEKARFAMVSQQLMPLTYSYDNPLSRKRNSELSFDHQSNTVFDKKHSEKPLALKNNSFDTLSFQTKLRMDLLKTPNFEQQVYHLVDRTRLKSYNIKKLGEEVIETPAGKFNAVKLEQRRGEHNKHTLIWLAKNWDYFVLRIQRIKDGKVAYQIDLKEATLGDTAIKPLR